MPLEPRPRVVVLAVDRATAETASRALTSSGLLPQAMLTDDLGAAVERADPRGPAPWVRLMDALSPREREVLQALVDGMGFTEASAALFVSRHTLRTHVKNILAKLAVHSSLEAVSVAVRAGMRPSGTAAPGRAPTG